MFCTLASSLHTYRLAPVLESDLTIVLNTTEPIVTLLSEASILVQRRCTIPEVHLLHALLDAYPQPCADATLYAALTGISPQDAQAFLRSADDFRDIALHPVHQVLKACRATLDALNLGIQPGEEGTYRFFRLER